MRYSGTLRWLCALTVLALAGCEESSVPPQVPPSGPGPNGSYPPGQMPPGGYGPTTYQPQAPSFPQPGRQQVPAPPQPSPRSLPTGPAMPNDPINVVDLGYLRAVAGSVLAELVAALPPEQEARVRGIPFVPDAKAGEVNAYAACDEERMPRMSVTDGLLQIQAYVAQFKATDEVFGTQKLDGYLQAVASSQQPGQGIVRPPAGLFDPNQHGDYRKVVRQHQLLEEQLAFVLGHELGHHYLGHTGCANGQSGDRAVTIGDLGRVLTKVVPVTNQPNEVAADVAGVNNLLTAGARRNGYHWTEGGALLTLAFFVRLDELSAASILFSFKSSHPNPALRVPVVNQAASQWRSSGGVGYRPWGLP